MAIHFSAWSNMDPKTDQIKTDVGIWKVVKRVEKRRKFPNFILEDPNGERDEYAFVVDGIDKPGIYRNSPKEFVQALNDHDASIISKAA